MPLTELQIKNAKPKDKVYRLTDGNGLSIEVTPKGSKLWRLRYYFNGKEKLMSLGKYPLISLAQARRLRDEKKLQLDEGKNPSRERKAEKLRRMQEHDNTFEKIARQCDVATLFRTENV